ncbi:DUF1573 domain-containing protein [Ferruginibacter sp.]
MKRLILSLTALVVTAAVFAQKKADEVAKFATETVDLGKIKQSVPATATFTVTNIGKEPLIIEQASPTCGCTIGDYTKEPIAPGKSGTITATYNAAAANHFEKHMTVKFAGVDEVKSITLTGDVLSAEDYAKWKGENPAPAAMVKSQPAAPAAKATTSVKSASFPNKPVKAVKTKKTTTATAKG